MGEEPLFEKRLASGQGATVRGESVLKVWRRTDLCSPPGALRQVRDCGIDGRVVHV